MKSAMRTLLMMRDAGVILFMRLYSQNNGAANKDEETVLAMESLSNETYSGSVKLTDFLSEKSLLCIREG